MPDSLLTYSIAPSSVDYSVTQGLSVVAVTLSATNTTADAVACSSIDITFPVADGAPKLTDSPDLVSVTAGTSTPWALWSAGDGTFQARALPPATSVAPGEVLTFTFTTIVVDDQPGTATISITDRQGTASLPLEKSQPTPAGGTAPHITSFVASPAQVALGAETTLTWAVENADSCSLVRESGGLRGLPTSLTPPGGGSVALPMSADTKCVLEAVGNAGMATAQVSVAVVPVVIDSFSAKPAGPVGAGTQVALSWSTRFAAGCSIDQGVGPVADAGSQQVAPTQTTLYTLTAGGLETAQRTIEVQVQ